MALQNEGLTKAYILFSRLNERYEALLREQLWRKAPSLKQLTEGFRGKLTEGLTSEQLRRLEPMLLGMVNHYSGHIYQQRHDGFRPRVLDVAYVLLCEEALVSIRRARGG